MILSNKRIIKVLIRLLGCAGCSVPLMFANPDDWFSHVVAHFITYNIRHLDKSAYKKILKNNFLFLNPNTYCEKNFSNEQIIFLISQPKHML